MFDNPYRAGNPISDQSGFFGREDIFLEVMQVLRHPHSHAIVLYGQRRIGKTSVLLQLEHQIKASGNYTPVYLDLQDKADKPLETVLYELAQRICATTSCQMPHKDLFDQDGEYFQTTFLSNVIDQSANGDLVLLFDEFDVLDSPTRGQAGADFFPYLRNWMGSVAQIQFVFVIGRRPEDLSTSTVATFKEARSTRVSFLSKKYAVEVVRQSQVEGSLNWSEEAVERVWSWTHGHPFFTQLLCSVIWENFHINEPESTQTAAVTDVDSAINDVLRQGANAFVWIWDGLPPAERVVMSAMAESKDTIITHDGLVEILNKSGVRLIVRQLELAPEILVEWELLQPYEDGYRFTYPLLRRWVNRRRPLKRTKDELDHVEPMADRLFSTGQVYVSRGQIDYAEIQLKRAIQSNPNHLKAKLLLGQILIEQEKHSEAVKILEVAYQYDQTAARAGLVQALLGTLDEHSENEQWEICSRIHEMQPGNALAESRKLLISNARKRRLLTKHERQASRLEQQENWQEAISIYDFLLLQLPEDMIWLDKRDSAQEEIDVLAHYNNAIDYLANDDLLEAQHQLSKVISLRPSFRESPRYLLMATGGPDIAELEETLRRYSLYLGVEYPPRKTRSDNRDDEAANIESTRILNALNPLDYLRLLGWMFWFPRNLTNYPEAKGRYSVIVLGKRLSATLIWLIFLPLLISAGMGTILNWNNLLGSPYLWLFAGTLAAWIINTIVDEDLNNGLLFIIFCLFALVTFGVVMYTTIDLHFGILSSVLLCLVVLAALTIISGMRFTLSIETLSIGFIAIGLIMGLMVGQFSSTLGLTLSSVFAMAGTALIITMVINGLIFIYYDKIESKLNLAKLSDVLAFGIFVLYSALFSGIVFGVLVSLFSPALLVWQAFTVGLAAGAVGTFLVIIYGILIHDRSNFDYRLMKPWRVRALGVALLLSFSFVIWISYLGRG